MSTARFRLFALVAWLMQALIVLSGAAVRLTDAGLGCEDWPTCNEGELFPEWQVHGLIEFGNRVISLFVTVSAIAVVIAARRLVPARPELVRYAWAIVVGTATQIVLGGITVLLDLHPIVVSIHFLVSMGLLWAAQSLWLLAGDDGTESDWFHYAGAGADTRSRTVGPVDQRTKNLARLQLGLASLVLLAGTVVTGTGPHSGDSRADRLGFDLLTVTRIHSACAWMLVASLVFFAVHLARLPDRGQPEISSGFQALRWMLVAMVCQGGIGYTQFALGLPRGLVEAHVLGALVVWSLSILVYRRLLGFPAKRRAATMAVL